MSTKCDLEIVSNFAPKYNPAGIYLFKVNNGDTRTTSWRRFGVFIVNFKQIFRIVLVFPLLTLKR